MKIDSLEKLLNSAVEKYHFPLHLKIDRSGETGKGDYATSFALQSFKLLTADQKVSCKNPLGWANNLVQEFKKTIIESELSAEILSVEVAGPGFINFVVSDTALQDVFKDTVLVNNKFKGKKIAVEFTDPNPFKEFHIGHLYSNTVGECLCRLFEANGAQVKRFCYQGDVGLHVAKSVWGMRKKILEKNSGIKEGLKELSALTLADRIKFLGQSYAMGASTYEENPDLAEEIKQINLLTFMSGQEELIEEQNWRPQVDYKSLLKVEIFNYQEIKLLFSHGRKWSLEYFDEIYHRLGMKFDDYYFESTVGEFGVQIVKQFLEKGIFKKSKGAVIFPGSEYGLHDRVFINSLGLPTYEAKELGLAPEKYRRYAYDLSFIITGNEIDEYFKVLLKAMSLTHPKLSAVTTHLSHGMVRLPEGKMSSRTGKIITGEWLLNEAKNNIKDYFKKGERDLTESENEKISEQVGMAAIKYTLLRNSLGKDISFSFSESLSFQGNSGPYLQYTAVRAKSILQKAGPELINALKKPSSYQFNPEEKAIAQLIPVFDEMLQKSATEYAPHLLCNYLYELAQVFNSFYNQNPVLAQTVSDSQRTVRLLLTQKVATTIERGLFLLGIQVPSKM